MQMREWKGWKERVSTFSGPIARDMGGFRADRSARGIRTKMSSREIESRYTNPDKRSAQECYTDKKENEILLIYNEIQMGAVAKSYIYEEGLPSIWGNAKIFKHIWGGRQPYMYDFAIDPFWFPYIWGKFDFLFYQCIGLPSDQTELIRKSKVLSPPGKTEKIKVFRTTCTIIVHSRIQNMTEHYMLRKGMLCQCHQLELWQTQMLYCVVPTFMPYSFLNISRTQI